MKILFMGTPTFAVPILEALAHDHEIVGVVTQPDRPGRKGTLLSSPVTLFAREHGLPLYQPASLAEDHDALLALDVDVLVTAAYGQLVPADLLALPRLLPLNVHGSLLPRWRGGAPIQRALLAGDECTGITFMVMAMAMDAGDIIEEIPYTIAPLDRADEVFASLSRLASARINDLLAAIARGDCTRTPQDPAAVTRARIIRREEEVLDFTKEDALALSRRIRALYSDPGSHFLHDGLPVKVERARVIEGRATVPAGCLERKEKTGIVVSCLGGSLLELQVIRPAGKGSMAATSWLNGIRTIAAGSVIA